jgi:nucleoside-diphosphate-sugar epimerase
VPPAVGHHPRGRHEIPREIPRQYLDCSKAREWLAWKPQRTLDQGLAETVAWYRRALGA